jgi:hypothetical protein
MELRNNLGWRLFRVSWDVIPYGGVWAIVALVLAYQVCFGR